MLDFSVRGATVNLQILLIFAFQLWFVNRVSTCNWRGRCVGRGSWGHAKAHDCYRERIQDYFFFGGGTKKTLKNASKFVYIQFVTFLQVEQTFGEGDALGCKGCLDCYHFSIISCNLPFFFYCLNEIDIKKTLLYLWLKTYSVEMKSYIYGLIFFDCVKNILSWYMDFY